MLVFKAQQIVSCAKIEPKAWEMAGKSGVAHNAKVAAIGTRGDVASITIKAKTAEELDKKLAAYVVGKPAEVLIFDVHPMFRPGERKASGYEYFG